MEFEMIPTFPSANPLHFWLNKSLDPAQNDACAYLRFDSAADARALYDTWARVIPADGHIEEPRQTDYGLLEWPMLDQYRNLLRIGGPIDQMDD